MVGEQKDPPPARDRVRVVWMEGPQAYGRTAADDANSVYAPGWVVWNARVGLRALRNVGVEPVVGVDNLFGRTYGGNVVTNA